MVGHRFFIRAFAAGALLVLAVCSRADSLRADFSPLTLRPRTNAPAIFGIKLHRAGAGLLEGALQITLEVGGEVLLRQQTQDLTLAAGTQSFRVITPPLPPHPSYITTEARLIFLTKAGATDLGRFPVEAVGRGMRNFVIAVCDGRGAGVRDVALWQSLRLEGLFPAAANAANFISTSPAYFAPEDFPANPLALFAFDLVLLDGDGFAQLREKQLAAVTRWVEAGGSLCVLPGRGLKDEHAGFLSAFAGGKDPAPWRITDTGEWVPTGDQPLLRRAGLGHVVIGAHPADVTLDAWTRAGGFLWKFRRSTADYFSYGSKSSQPMNLARSLDEAQREARQQRDEVGQLLKTLLPQSTRLISPLTLALILAGFLLVVGPLDWFTLGAVRRRRWTWIAFPLASAGFTALVISEAGRALGREDHRASLTITDVGPGGRVLRESRFELRFAARNQESLTEIRNGFAVPTDLGARDSGGSVETARFAGQMPARFTMRQHLRQWTPQFNRVTTLEASGSSAAIPWGEIETAVAAGVREPDISLRAFAMKHAPLGTYLFNRDNVMLSANPSAALPAGLTQLCRGPKHGIGGLLARIAPDAAGDFGDLPLLDPGDPHEWLFVIFRETPDGVHLYRRLFRTDD